MERYHFARGASLNDVRTSGREAVGAVALPARVLEGARKC